ncbi:MAG: LptF/LptG family permease [Opitutaceae bacterium]|nr:LptF/LptG family permease [Opitutaceae bacterium]
MKLLHRHLFTSMALTCLAAVGLFVFVLMLGNVIRDMLGYALSGQIEPGLFIRLVALTSVAMSTYALPLGVLAGVLLVLGRMSSDREITAMRSAGLSLARIATPVVIFALLGVAAAVAINFYFMPRAKVTYEAELADAVRQNPLSFIVPKTFIRDFPGTIVYVNDKQGALLKDVWIWKLDRQKRVRTLVHAQSGRIDYDEANNRLLVTLRRFTSQEFDHKNPEDLTTAPLVGTMEKFSDVLPLDNLFGQRTLRQKLQWMTFNELRAEWNRIKAQRAATPEESTQLELQRMKVQITIHEKFTTAFSVLSFALIGIPLGLKVSRKETSANLGIALALAMAYYFLTIAVGWLDQHPSLRPDLLMWAPNFIFQALGCCLIWRVDRSSGG